MSNTTMIAYTYNRRDPRSGAHQKAQYEAIYITRSEYYTFRDRWGGWQVIHLTNGDKQVAILPTKAEAEAMIARIIASETVERPTPKAKLVRDGEQVRDGGVEFMSGKLCRVFYDTNPGPLPMCYIVETYRMPMTRETFRGMSPSARDAMDRLYARAMVKSNR